MAAVAERGEVELEIGGQRYTLVLDIEAVCQLESASTMRLQQVFEEVHLGSMRHTRMLFHAALRRHHPTVTVEEIGRWSVGDILGAIEGVAGKLASYATPDAKDEKALGLKRPRKAQTKK